MKKIIASVVLAATVSVSGALATALDYKVYRADAQSFDVASVIISGKKDAVLIDAQFSKADAHRVVAEILAQKKNLTTVYVSHGDPDYYFGLPIIKEAFPQAKIIASPETIKHIQKTYQKKLTFWGPKLGTNGSDFIIMPTAIKGDTITLEDQALKVIGLDSKQPKRTYVWVPSLKAVFGGINIFGNKHPWMADAASTKDREEWLAVLKEIEKLNPSIVIPGHASPGSKTDATTITFMKKYLMDYEAAVSNAKDSKELIATMKKLYPNAGGQKLSLGLGAKVVKGEITW